MSGNIALARMSPRAHILDSVLIPNENLALLFPTSNTLSDGEVKAWFFRVISRSKINFTYDSELPVIAAGKPLLDPVTNTPYYGSITKDTFNSGITEDDYLRIPDNYPFLIYHYAVGIRPSYIWLYKEYNGTRDRVMFPNLEITPGAKHDYVDGYLSPFDSPRVIATDIVTKGIRVKYSFYNDSDRDTRPSLHFLGAAYAVVPITKKDAIDKMISGKIPCRFQPVFSLRAFSFTKPDEWVEPVIINIDRIAEVV